MDHLACFAGGMYGLAAHQENDANSDRWMKIAEEILLFTPFCSYMYSRQLILSSIMVLNYAFCAL